MKKLVNKETGQVGVLGIHNEVFCVVISGALDNDYSLPEPGATVYKYSSLPELAAEWEDYKEPTDKIENIWSGNRRQKTVHIKCNSEKYAKEVLLKLKAWERLKEKGFKFLGINEDYTRIPVLHRDGRRYLLFNKSEDEVWLKENWKDLYLLFGGEK